MNYIYKKMIGGLFAKLKAVLTKVGIPENLCLPVATLVAVAVIAGAVYYFLGDKIKSALGMGEKYTEVSANDAQEENYEEIEEPFEDDYETDEDDFESDLEEAFENLDEDDDEDFNAIGNMDDEEMQALGQL